MIMMWRLGKLKYNVAPAREIDLGKLVKRCASILILALVFLFFGLSILAQKNDEKREKLAELARVQQQLNRVEQNSAEYSRLIARLKKEWGKQVAFTNRIIDSDTFSIVAKLDILEDMLPVGLSIQSLQIKNNKRSEVVLKIHSHSFPKLVKLYEQLARFDLKIKNESEVDGTYQANLTVEIPDEDH